MKRKTHRRAGKEALALLEEGIHLLRRTPLRVFVLHWIGALPFVLGFLFFWADMGQNAFARDRSAPAALVLALLFVWMKSWQALFARGLWTEVSATPESRLTVGRWSRILVNQSILQPWGLLVLPLAAGILLPLGWVFAWFQNLTVLDDGQPGGAGTLRKQAAELAGIWPAQNFALLGVISLFGIVVFLDIGIFMQVVPYLMKTFLGIETAFSRSSHPVSNTTFLAAAGALTWLCLDPLIKAVYVLRVFYARSQKTGDDLRLQFRHGAMAPGAALLLLGGLLFAAPENGLGQGASGGGAVPVVSPSVDPSELDETIGRTLKRREFAWRLPREEAKLAREEMGPVKGFIADAAAAIRTSVRDIARSIGNAARKVMRGVSEWLGKLFPDREPRERSGAPSSGFTLRIFAWTVFAVLAAVFGVLLYRLWQRREKLAPVESEGVEALPDLEDENVVADQLPEDGWMRLAREMIEKGELRLALRAFYLASLAHLADRQLLTIARFKSNLDYRRELDRRGRALPDVQQAFHENVSSFDRVWYGLYDVSREILDSFQRNFERIRSC